MHRRARRRDRERGARGWVRALAGAVVAPVLVGVVVAALTSDGDEPAPTDERRNQAVTDAGPLTVAVEQDTYASSCTGTWVVPRSPDEIRFADGDEERAESDAYLDWSDHPAGEGGAPGSPLTVVATVRGTSDAQVTLLDLVPHVRRLGEAPAGTILQRSACGGEGAFRWLVLDLDNPGAPLRSEYSEEMEALAEPVPEREKVPIRFPYEVSLEDAESFLIEAHTASCDCEWWLDLHWQAGTESGVLTIDDHGEPFRTVGRDRAYAACEGDGVCGAVGPEP